MAAVEQDIHFPETNPTFRRVLELVERGRKFPEREGDKDFHEELGRIERYVRLFLGLGPQGEPPTEEMMNKSIGEINTEMFRVRLRRIGIIM